MQLLSELYEGQVNEWEVHARNALPISAEETQKGKIVRVSMLQSSDTTDVRDEKVEMDRP